MIRLLRAGFLLGLPILLTPSTSHAFHELVRYGYVHCTSCHVSPSGGGVLTEYGRQISAEVLSAWAVEPPNPESPSPEAEFLWNAVKLPSWLNAGGDIRAVELYRNTPQVTANRFIFMQADLEAAATVDRFTLDASAGYYNEQVQSRRYYALYRVNDYLDLRGGRFQRPFGLLLPDHVSFTRRDIGWDEGSEMWGVEADWLGEHFGFQLTGQLGDPINVAVPDEKGPVLRAYMPVGDGSQIGLSFFHGNGGGNSRNLGGPFAVIGPNHHAFILAELDVQSATYGTGATAQTGFVDYVKGDWEFRQGFHLYVVQEQSRLDFSNAATSKSAWGGGMQVFPRPHFEFDVEYQQLKTATFPDDWTSYLTVLIHAYL